jgi:hypothetical protein
MGQLVERPEVSGMSGQNHANGCQYQLPPLDRSRLVFLSFQASGPERGSWPIEIGIARVRSDGSVRAQGSLIQPHPTWPENQWSPASEQINGISLEMLNSAPPADVIAAEYLELMAGMTLVSDSLELDSHCLDMLAATISAPDTFDVQGYNAIFAPYGFAGIKRAHSFLRGLHPSHRAGHDAGRLAVAWVAAAKGDS